MLLKQQRRDKYLNTVITKEEIDAINSVMNKLHQTSKNAGWYNKPREDGTFIALIHSEVSEALEGVRKGLMDDHLPHRSMVEVEMADAIIRILDYVGFKGLDIGGAIAEKNEYNKTRQDHKLESRNSVGGKSF